ncbi:MAG: riboflavin synthase [Armatimonadota bacterium]
MFTGIVEEVGRVTAVRRQGLSVVLGVEGRLVCEGTKVGDSIAVSGVCLTVTSVSGGVLTFDAVAETLRRTTLADVHPGRMVNLERALSAGARMGGHFVQGHVDGLATLASVDVEGNSHLLSFAVGKELSQFLVEKGSVALDGVSLTVAALRDGGLGGQSMFTVAVVPHTWENTTLRLLSPGDQVNLEVDIIGKYVARFLGVRSSGVTEELLRSAGFA